MKKRYTKEQIIKAIEEHEARAKVDHICRSLDTSNGTYLQLVQQVRRI